MVQAKTESLKADVKSLRHRRSPAFPFLPLNKALERADQFRIAEGGRPKHFAPTTSAGKAWGIGSKTGPFLQTVAALGHYDLVEFQGGGENRTMRLTESALNILLDKQPVSVERDVLVQKAALAPRIHGELWQKWKDGLPSNATLETYLVRDRGFTDTGAKDLIAEYKVTLTFAKLGQLGIIPPETVLNASGNNGLPDIAVGDLVQVEINGALQFEAPKHVRDIQEYKGEKYVFVDGHDGATPMSQVTLEAKGTIDAALTPPATPLLMGAGGSVKTRYNEQQKESEILHGQLSRSVSYRLLVEGFAGPKELGKLIKILELQKSLLEDDEEDEN